LSRVARLLYRLRTHFLGGLTKVGARLSATRIRQLNSLVNYLEVGRWLEANGFASAPRFADRWLMYDAVAAPIAAERVLYLEFGVYEGYTLRRWAKLLTNPASSLHGFDSFEGLPESWDETRPKGTFDVKGAVPRYDDPRVSLHKGWFEETLPGFALPAHDRLVIHVDADLYSSARFVLDTLRDSITPGTVIVFDEFCDRMHEMKAFEEFLRATGARFRFLAGTTNLEQVTFERVA
jgi:hypothetical protein